VPWNKGVVTLAATVVVPAPTGTYLSIAGLNTMIRSLIDNRRVPFLPSTGVYLVVTSADISHDRSVLPPHVRARSSSGT
jgi:hypothetical protein